PVARGVAPTHIVARRARAAACDLVLVEQGRLLLGGSALGAGGRALRRGAGALGGGGGGRRGRGGLRDPSELLRALRGEAEALGVRLADQDLLDDGGAALRDALLVLGVRGLDDGDQA